MSFRLSPLIRGSAPFIVLQRPVLLIGRHPECDVRINSPKISRRHCCLAMAYDRVLIRDLGSRNGIRVNGRSVDESRLYDGDELAIGPIIFRLETINETPETIGAPSARPVASPPRPPGRSPVPPAVVPATAPPLRLSQPDSEIDLVPLEDD
jgi:pSer/pThr/pTyr-binding forkhead associated (FHA) protein